MEEAEFENFLISVSNAETIELRGETSKNIKKFGEFIKTNTTCKQLYINTDPLLDSAWVLLCEGLAENKTVEGLYFSDCFIDAGVCEELAKVIKQNKSISKLRIYGNSFGYAGTRYICEALKENDAIVDLDLNSNNIDADAWIFFDQLLDVNKTIEKLRIDYNPVYYVEYYKQITARMEQNKQWRKERKMAMMILKKNIERQGVVFDLPKELWLIILAYQK